MKALVIGGAGFIGLHLARHLQDGGFSVDIVDTLSPDPADRDLNAFLEGADGHKDARMLSGDISDPASLAALDNDYTHIVHLAAMLGVENVLNNAYAVLDVNVRLTVDALRLASKQRNLKQFVFASTSEVYAGTLEHGSLSIPTPESSPIVLSSLAQPRTSYMLSKLYGEALCEQSGLPCTIIRPHNVYGPRMGMRHVIPQLLQRAHETGDDTLEVYSPTHTRTFCYVSDAVEIIRRLMTTEEAIGKAVNVGSQAPEISIRQLAEFVVSEVGRDLKLVDRPATAGSPSRRAPKMELCKAITGYESETSLQSGIAKTYEWYRPTFKSRT